MYSPNLIGKVVRSQPSSIAASCDVQEPLMSSTSPMPLPSGFVSESSRTAPVHHVPCTRAAGRRGPQPVFLPGAILLVAQQTAATSGTVPAAFLPSPLVVINRIWLGLTQAGLGSYAGVMLKEALLGCLLAAVFALPLARALHHWRFFPRVVPPYVAVSQAVLGITPAPLLVLQIGYGTLSMTIPHAFMVPFPITITVFLGLRDLDTDVIDAARLGGAYGSSMLAYMELPMTLPAIYTGLHTGFTLSITGAVVGEMIIGGDGLGMLLSTQCDKVDTTGTSSIITLLCPFAITIHQAFHEPGQRSRTVDALRDRRAG